MPRTIPEGFDDLLEKLKIVNGETEALKSHRASISSCLESNFGLKYFFKTGSIGNGTNVNGFSDTDYFASIPRGKLHKNSHKSLVLIKEALQTRFPKTHIYIDSPAVVVNFGKVASENTEIIPADCIEVLNDELVYEIPDGSCGWMKSSPKASNKYVTEINSKLNMRVKYLIRLAKAIKFYNNIPVSSYYLEMRIAKYAYSQGSISYLIDLQHILWLLLHVDLAKMTRPTGVGGYILACKTQTKKDDSISKIHTAYNRINNAIACKDKGEISSAFEWLDKLFNGKFPSYYK